MFLRSKKIQTICVKKKNVLFENRHLVQTWSSSFLQTAILSLAMRRCRPIIRLSTVRMAFASWQATLERKLCKKVALVNSYSDRIQMKQARRTLQTHSLTKPNSNWKFSFTKKEVKYAHFPPFFPACCFPFIIAILTSCHCDDVTGIASIWRIWAEQRITFFIKANLSST